MTPDSTLGWRLVQALSLLAGLVTAVCLLIVLADLAVLAVLMLEEANNAWYFPYSVFVLPVLAVTGSIFFLTRRALRRRNAATSD